MIFEDRHDAGRKLAVALQPYKKAANAIVLGLARGGVIVAFEVAQALQIPLDIVCPRKVGAPNNSELALGAVTPTGSSFFNEDILRLLQPTPSYLKQEIEKEKMLAIQRLKLYRQDRPALQAEGKTIILVDDGIATGATMKACIQWAKDEKAKKIVVASPVSSQEALQEIKALCDEAVCLYTPSLLNAVGQFYKHFDQASDDEVKYYLSTNNLCS